MSEQDGEDALQAQIDEAKAAGDLGKANELYHKQIGFVDPRVPVEVVPEVVDEGKVTDSVTSPASQDFTVATGAEDETVTVTPAFDFVGNAEHRAGAVAEMREWDADATAALEAKWGSDMGVNLMYQQAFAEALPEVNAIIQDHGLAGHPGIVEIGVILGRRYATVGGDPSTITTRKAGPQMADNTNTAAIEARIEALSDEIDEVRAKGRPEKANALYQEQLALERRLPGGGGPIVGSQGRTS